MCVRERSNTRNAGIDVCHRIALTISRVLLPSLAEDEDEWLSRYLLACKNSLEGCKKRIEYFFTVQSMWPEYFSPPSADVGIAFAEYM